jgi:TolB-like protein/predicted Ser/Thr protein kinase
MLGREVNIGMVLGHYRIVEKIGAGGMGVVYRARDERLDRDVALKVLPDGTLADESARKRFRKEALTLSKLNHPNIAVVHDFDTQDGLDFLVMEYVTGVSLEQKLGGGALPEKGAAAIGEQIAKTLEEAHELGVIHRDLKPGNIMLTAKGQVKLLDFGIAILLRAREEDATESLTEGQQGAGTLLYMAPERLRGQAADERSDIYSLGVVLYELLTCHLPFQGTVATAVVDEILNQAPTPPSRFQPRMSPKLEEIILKCLDKEPEERYQSAAEVRVDLRRLSRLDTAPQRTATSVVKGGRATRRVGLVIGLVVLAAILAAAGWRRWREKRITERAGNMAIAVLPFEDVAGKKGSEYMRFALADEVVGTLSYMPGLAVRPFTLTRKYADGNTDPRRVAQELQVNEVVTGHFLQEEEKLRITLEVMEPATSRLVWRETVSGSSQDLIALQREMALRLRDELAPALGVGKTTVDTAAQPKNQEAYELYLRGKGAGVDPAPNKEAIALLERSLALDPNYAPALAALALRLNFDANFSDGGAEATRKSMESAERALALDPQQVEAATFLASRLVEDGELNRAFDQVADLVRRRPDNGLAHDTLGYVLRYAGLLDDAARECDEARRLDPTITDLSSCGVVFMYKGDYNRARSYFQLQGETDYWAAETAAILLREGKAREAVNGLLKKVPYETEIYGRSVLEACLGPTAKPEKEAAVARRLKYADMVTDPELKYQTATEMALCGRTRDAVRLLRQAIEHNYCVYPLVDTDPLLKTVRSDPQFAEIRAAAQQCQQRFQAHRAAAGK